MKLLSSSGVGAIAQQSLISPMMLLASLLGTVLGACFGYTASSSLGMPGTEFITCTAGALVGYVVVYIGLKPVDAGAKTLFVCYAEEPAYLQNAMPELYEKIGQQAPPKQAAGEETPLAQP